MSVAESSSVKHDQPAPTPAPEPRSAFQVRADRIKYKLTTRYVFKCGSVALKAYVRGPDTDG